MSEFECRYVENIEIVDIDDFDFPHFIDFEPPRPPEEDRYQMVLMRMSDNIYQLDNDQSDEDTDTSRFNNCAPRTA